MDASSSRFINSFSLLSNSLAGCPSPKSGRGWGWVYVMFLRMRSLTRSMTVTTMMMKIRAPSELLVLEERHVLLKLEADAAGADDAEDGGGTNVGLEQQQ